MANSQTKSCQLPIGNRKMNKMDNRWLSVHFWNEQHFSSRFFCTNFSTAYVFGPYSAISWPTGDMKFFADFGFWATFGGKLLDRLGHLLSQKHIFKTFRHEPPPPVNDKTNVSTWATTRWGILVFIGQPGEIYKQGKI